MIEVRRYGPRHLDLRVDGPVDKFEEFNDILTEYILGHSKKTSKSCAEFLLKNSFSLVAIDEIGERCRLHLLDEANSTFKEWPIHDWKKLIARNTREQFECFAHALEMANNHLDRISFFAGNEDLLGVQVMAVLDSRYSPICADEDEKCYSMENIPILPHFVGCRCCVSPLDSDLSEDCETFKKNFVR